MQEPPQRVIAVIADIDIPFMSMVTIMVKLVVAAIPASIILFLLALAATAILTKLGSLMG